MEAVNEAEDDEHTDEDEDSVILPLSWLNNIQQRGRIRHLHVHPSRFKNQEELLVLVLPILFVDMYNLLTTIFDPKLCH